MESGNFVTEVDPVFIFVTVVSILFIIGITVTMIYFLFRYHKKRNKVAKDIHGHAGLEVAWTLIPLILVTAMFYFGWVGFEKMLNPPEDAYEIDVTGRMWSWLFEYENGVRTDTLYVPIQKPIKLILSSIDVIHSFYIPAFRIKKDVVPGRLKTDLWFVAQEPGSYDVLCAEYCGERHSYMLTKVVAMPEAEFDSWLAETGKQFEKMELPEGEEPSEAVSVQRGEMRVKTKGGCLACHSLDGSRLVGPSFKGIYGKEVEVLVNGQQRTVTVDESYLVESIVNPGAKIVKGYPAVMPPAPLSEEEVKEVVAYIKSLK